MSCFGPSLVQPSAVSQDPTKHVNYELGMVLGVDDLNQEFAYLSERDQWTARDLLGYGTVWGLRVATREGPTGRGPEVTISSGAAVSPRGQLIRVAPTQCASLNDWLAARTDQVQERRVPTTATNVFTLPLYVVLSYRECLTDPVPIAGEPCRSESDSTKPSRATDDFLLELSFDPPPQQEEDAVREFVQWLRSHITVTSGGVPSLTVGEFLDSIRQAADAAAVPTSLPSGEFLLDGSLVTALSVPAAQLSDYLSAALRLWVTELRPRWRPMWLGDNHGCAGDVLPAPDQGNQLLLAALTVSIVPPGLLQPGWTVTSFNDIVISEERRPLLLHMRFLQEWLLAETTPATAAGGVTGPLVVAAGVIQADPATATTRAVLGGLHVVSATDTAAATATDLELTFDSYVAPLATGGPQYLVKCLPWPSAELPSLIVTFVNFATDGFILRVSKGGAVLTAADLAGLQLMTEVSQYT